MSKPAQAIALTDAERLLHKAEDLSVLVQVPTGSTRQELWGRARVLAFMRAHGALLAGIDARRLHHGVASLGPDGNQYMFETGHTQPRSKG